jgi:hypothetical protein
MRGRAMRRSPHPRRGDVGQFQPFPAGHGNTFQHRLRSSALNGRLRALGLAVVCWRLSKLDPVVFVGNSEATRTNQEHMRERVNRTFRVKEYLCHNLLLSVVLGM